MMNLPLLCSTRTLSISETHLTSLLDEHQEALEGLEVLEVLVTLSEDQMYQVKYPSLNSSLYSLQEI